MTLTPLPPPSSTIPSHLSETQYRRYEPYLARALRAWPSDTSFECDPDLAVTTFIARFRDAILSLQRFGWDPRPGCEISIPLLASIAKQYTIAADPGTRTVWFRKKVRAGAPMIYGGLPRGTPPPASTLLSPPPSPSPVHQMDITDAELCSYLCLVNNNRLSGPILLSGDFTKHPFVGQYANVSMFWDAEKGVTVVT